MNENPTSPREIGRLPGWLPLVNRLVMWLQRRGLRTGTVHVLIVPGRRTGELRSTPVSVLTIDGVEYAVGGLPTADWVRNVRAASWGHIAYGRHTERVTLTELAPAERVPVLRAFPIEVPHGTQFFERLYGVRPDPDEFATLADRCTVFRIDRPGPEDSPLRG